MSKLLATTAAAFLLAAPAFAQTADPAPVTTTEAVADAAAPAAALGTLNYAGVAGDMSAKTFIGKRLYASEIDVDTTGNIVEVNKDWDDIGEISDLVLGSDGQVKAVIVDIGGFLGMGEKSVALTKGDLAVIRDGDSENDYFIVVKADKAALEAAPAFEWPQDK